MAPEALAGKLPGTNRGYTGFDNIMIYNDGIFPPVSVTDWKVRQEIGASYDYNHCSKASLESSTSPWSVESYEYDARNYNLTLMVLRQISWP